MNRKNPTPVLFITFGMAALLTACVHEPMVSPGETITDGGSGGTEPEPGDTCDPSVAYFEQEVLPIFVQNCTMSGCHNTPTDANNEVVLTSYLGVMNDAYFDDIWDEIGDGDMPPDTMNPLTSQDMATLQLMGDSIHNFCDGIIIAAAFLVDVRLGVVTSLAIIAHEIPQEVGDYVVLLNAGFSRGKALFYNALSGLAAVVGGVLGYYVVGPWEALFPYLLVVAASSFIYVAVADLIPQLQHRLALRATLAQLAWLGAGLLLVALAVSQLHDH